ncbi:putative F-box/FBD/LRR-repeat protein [Cardamine amara subsp. amara]|uniref:F-box/FBD/LRR-repeat protein n=1 Tax=Cardamine amara subsp. amara TaxID=228776 RepID=A0ABD1BJQ0_CARAN
MKAARLGMEELSYTDRISHLPDDLLFRILSLIPVSDAMSTSLLSKRWKSLWKMMPTLEYDENTCPNIGSLGFDQFCGRSLQLHQAPLLKTLNLKLRKQSNSIDSLIFPSIHSTLLETTITSTCYPRYDSNISFPDNLRVFQTLAVLKLHGNILLDLADDSPISSSKDFAVSVVFFSTISVPSLLRLSLTKEHAYCSNDAAGIEIKAPSLKYLKIFDRVGSFDFIEDMPNLVEANVRVDLSKNEKLLKVLTSVEHLSLDLYPLMVFDLAYRLISNRLVHLELYIYDNFRSNLLLHLLKDLPNLRALKLNHPHPNYSIKDQPSSVSEPSSVPKCLSSHLETFQWIGYAGTLEEIKAAVYVLKNAPCLKNATISLYSTSMESDLIMMKELESFSKASTSCKLVIQLHNSS